MPASKQNGKTRRSGKLVIVESPAKARTVGRFLGKGYTVKASVGHIRDLLRSRLSVDVENDFEPTYRVPNEKRAVVKEIKEAAAKASEVFLATDPDREGEAIAWHLVHAAEIDPQVTKRVVFHEITNSAISEAFDHPRDVDERLVNAQQARRILDRLVGYNITELLWDRVRNRLSAGRVQSVAVRLVVEREKEIQQFVPQEYWTIDVQLTKHGKGDKKTFVARLLKIHDQDAQLSSEAEVTPHVAILERSLFKVADIKEGTRLRRPSAPFTTSTLQQEASKALNFTASRTMSIAQQLYEGIEIAEGVIGLITYMRTDSTTVSKEAQDMAREFVTANYGAEFLPDSPPQYKTKAKSAQEAHEAIRPTDVKRTPDSMKSNLSRDQLRLYTLIWRRFVASQMANALYNTLRVDIAAGETEAQMPYLFRASGSTIQFKGFLAVYEETQDEDRTDENDEGRTFPRMEIDELLKLLAMMPEQHFTQPPPRYTEATLVKALEEKGIGRPSTYAPTVAVIQDRAYVAREDKRLRPTETGVLVNDLLVEYFPEVMSFDFTAMMEDQLDSIADGDLEWVAVLRDFYHSFEGHLTHAQAHMPHLTQEEYIGRGCPECGQGELIVRYGRWGKFIGCNRYPDCAYTEPWKEYIGVSCRTCHTGEIIAIRSHSGRVFFGCTNYNREKPEEGCQFTSWKRPLSTPCPNCDGILVLRNKKTAECLTCENTYPLAELPDEQALLEGENPVAEMSED